MYRFGWDQRTVGLSLAVVGVCSIICSAVVVGPVVSWIGERRALLTGLAFASAGFVLYGLAASTWAFLLAIGVNSLWSLASPTSQALMTRKVSPSEQGELQGAIASLRGIAMIIGPFLFSATFAYFIAPQHRAPSAPWYLAAALLAAALGIAAKVTDPSGGVRGVTQS